MKNKLILFIIFAFILFITSSFACDDGNKEMKNLFVPKTVADQLMFSTVRIDTDISKGTGFVFNFQPEIQGIKYFPCIVTNRHVIINNEGKEANSGVLVFHKKAIDKEEPRGNGDFITLSLNDFSKQWIFHPDHNKDLCILPLAKHFPDPENQPFFKGLDKRYVLPDEELYSLSAAEEVIMVGYPSTIRDDQNNFPLFRRGICSSHPAFDFNGSPGFLIDIASFPGSSGSPVCIYNKGFYRSDVGSFYTSNSRLVPVKDRFIFMGLMSSSHETPVNGTVTGLIFFKDMKSSTNIPTHLGYVIKAKILLEFEKLLPDILKNEYDLYFH